MPIGPILLDLEEAEAFFLNNVFHLKRNTYWIYTKIGDTVKGFAGALRNISLNSIAAKLPTSARNESNYYASELEMIPKLEAGEEHAQVFLTKVDGDLINYNFISSLKRIK